MKDRSPTIRSKRATGSWLGFEVAGVDAFERGHALIGREPRVQLAVADVDADDVLRAALQQRVGEAAGALAEVEAGHAGDVDAEPRQRAVELQAAARDEAQLGVVGDLDFGAARQVFARLGRHPQPAGARQRTAPVAISRCAADRVGAMPRSTSSWSARMVATRCPRRAQ